MFNASGSVDKKTHVYTNYSSIKWHSLSGKQFGNR